MIAFVPLFFFASEYAQISLGESASETGLYLLIFFAGFATATQWGGKMLDRIGARRPVVLGCAVGAVGFYLWGNSMTHLSVSEQWYYIVLAGIGVGLVLSPANTDALNRVARNRYGEATGITQTVRNFGSSLGLAILGSLLITWNKSNLESIARRQGRAEGQSRRGRRMRLPGRSDLPVGRPGARLEGGRGLQRRADVVRRSDQGRLLRDGDRARHRLRRSRSNSCRAAKSKKRRRTSWRTAGSLARVA